MREIENLKKLVFWLALFLLIVWGAVLGLPDNQLHLVFCDVGQGDAALITYKTRQILVDGGPDNRVLNCLGKHMPFWDRKIEVLVATHPDADHITGLIDVIERYNVSYFLINSAGENSMVFARFKEAVLAEGAEVYFPQAGDQVELGPLTMSFLWPQSQEKVLGATTLEREANETSVVFELTLGSFEALFPGDIDLKAEAQLELEDIEVLKVPHHGSKYSTGEDFLAKIMPELAIISVGKNSFGHPTDEVIEQLTSRSIKFLRTDREGEIEVISDGQNWGIRR